MKIELNKKLSEIQQKLKAPKSQYNSFGKYHFRNSEDILEAVKPLLGELTLIIRDEVYPVVSGENSRFYIKATATISDGEEFISSVAYARESDTKSGMDQAQVTGASSSYARKYALNGLFAIDDTKDADNNDNSPKEPEKKTTAKEKVEADGLHTVSNGKVVAKEVKRDAFRDEKGEIVRDGNGHTACASCGRLVGDAVEKYSIKKFGSVLCMACQGKELAKKQVAKTENITSEDEDGSFNYEENATLDDFDFSKGVK
jgi:hypothetical protein